MTKRSNLKIKEQKQMSKRDVVVKESAPPPALVEAVPDFMKAEAGRGVEKLGQGDVAVPRIKLLQSNSPEVENNRELRAGEFYHTLAEVSLGESLRVVPIYTDISAILWRPRAQGGGILARLQDNIHWNPPNAKFEVDLRKTVNDPSIKVVWQTKPTEQEAKLLDWGSSNPADPNSQPAATKMYNVVAFLPDYPELSPVVITLQRVAVRAAQQLTGRIKMSGAPSYGMYFDMTAVQDRNSANQTYFNYRFAMDGFVKDVNEFKRYKEFYEHFSKMGVNIRDVEGLQDDDTSSGTSSGVAAPVDSKAKF